MFCFAIGASVGSFLNVVVYRMPAGINLAYPPSRCPACKTPIRPWNNLPILSWLVLRGRCPDCKTPIAARYFWVELFTASMFAGLYVLELQWSGINLPTLRQLDDEVWLWNRYSFVDVATYIYHAVLLSYLVAVTLIRFDRQPIPQRLVIYGLLLGIVPVLFWPSLHPVPLSLKSPESDSGVLQAIVGVAVGWGAGLLIGLTSSAIGVASTMAIAGAFMGWSAAISVGCVASGGLLLLAFAGIHYAYVRNVPAVAAVSLGATIQLVFWKQLVLQPYWPGPRAALGVHAVATVALVGMALAAHRLRRSDPFL